MRKRVGRREFLTILVGGAGFALLPGMEANAFWQFALRFIVRGAIRRSASRAVVPGLTTSAARRYSMKSVSSLEVSAGMVISISPEVYALAEEHKAEAVWVRAGYDNQFTAALENDSPSHVSGQFHYGIENVNTGRLEKEKYGGLIYAGPGDKFEFPFDESDLPSPGVKRIIGRTDNPNIRCNPSGNIIVANPEDVHTE